MKYYIGIDPGKTGAIAIVSDNDGEAYVFDYLDKEDPFGVAATFNEFIIAAPGTMEEIQTIMIEKQSPASGRTASFTLGMNYGAWLNILESNSLKEIAVVTPAAWRKIMLPGVRGREALKKAAIERCEDTYPYIKFATPRGRKLDGRADALLIAEYAKLMRDKL